MRSGSPPSAGEAVSRRSAHGHGHRPTRCDGCRAASSTAWRRQSAGHAQGVMVRTAGWLWGNGLLSTSAHGPTMCSLPVIPCPVSPPPLSLHATRGMSVYRQLPLEPSAATARLGQAAQGAAAAPAVGPTSAKSQGMMLDSAKSLSMAALQQKSGASRRTQVREPCLRHVTHHVPLGRALVLWLSYPHPHALRRSLFHRCGQSASPRSRMRHPMHGAPPRRLKVLRQGGWHLRGSCWDKLHSPLHAHRVLEFSRDPHPLLPLHRSSEWMGAWHAEVGSS